MFHKQRWIIDRRIFLKSSVVTLAGMTLAQFSCSGPVGRNRSRGILRFGIVADCHYADADTIGTRYYRHSLDKLAECVEVMNEQQVDFLVELGDFKDQDSPPIEQKTLSYLQAVGSVFRKFDGPTYHVLGNHDADSISKTQFLNNIKNTGINPSRSYYSFDFNDVHFVVLDANYKSDGTNYDHGNFDWTDANIPPVEFTMAQARPGRVMWSSYYPGSPASRRHRLVLCQKCRRGASDPRTIGQGLGSIPGSLSRRKL